MVPLEHVVALSGILFVIGVCGALLRRNLIAILMSVELMLSAANLALIGFNRAFAAAGGEVSVDGQVFALLVTSVAAAEVAVGLGILASLARNRSAVEDASLLEW